MMTVQRRNRVAAASLALGLALSACAGLQARVQSSPKQTVVAGDHLSGEDSGIESLKVRVIRTAFAWNKMWQRMGKKSPAFDADARIGVAVFLGTRPRTGYRVMISNPMRHGAFEIVSFTERIPERGSGAVRTPTTPYAIRLIATTDTPILFRDLVDLSRPDLLPASESARVTEEFAQALNCMESLGQRVQAVEQRLKNHEDKAHDWRIHPLR